MNKKLFQSGKSLLSKLCLTSLLLIGMGNTAWADTAVVDGSTIADGWTNGGAIGFIPSTGSAITFSSAFIIGDGQITPATTTYGSGWNGYTWYTLKSSEKISLYTTQKIEISAKGTSSSSEIVVAYSTDGSTWTNYKDFTTEVQNSTTDFSVFTVDNLTDGEYYLLFAAKGTLINSIKITGETPAITTPKIKVSPLNIDLGSIRATATETVTVTNDGIGTMDVTIANDNTTDFTVSVTSLTGIGEGDSKTFDVIFNYNSENLGAKAANITVTPTYDETKAVTISATATAVNPNVWEDFSEGILSTWYKEDWWSVSNGQARVTTSGYYLRTPKLYAEKDAMISCDVNIDQSSYSTYFLQAEYSTDCKNWTVINRYTSTNSAAFSGTMTFAAPETGNYWLRFNGSHASIDNFSGWAIADTSLDMFISTSSIPSTGVIGGDYTASVIVTERGGVGETISAELYFGDEVVDEQTNVYVKGNSNYTLSFTYPLTEEWEGEVYVKITGDNIGVMETDKTAVTISEPTIVLDENGDGYATATTKPTCSNAVVKLKYTVQQGWNTIVLPFSPSESFMTQIFGSDYTAYAISSYEDGHLKFSKYTYLSSSTPYLVYAPNAEVNTNGIYLKGVSIFSGNWTSSNLNKSVSNNAAIFKGTFSPIAAPGMEGKYGVTTSGQIMNGNASASIKGYRAYFEFAEGSTPAKLSIVIDENDAPTLIGAVQMMEDNAAVYDMMGRKVETLNGKVVSGQLPKGIYIVNGKKVIVK